MSLVSGVRSLVVAGMGLMTAAASIAATEPPTAGTPIVAAAETESPKRDTNRQTLSADNAATGVGIEPLTLAFAGLGVGVLLLLRRIER